MASGVRSRSQLAWALWVAALVYCTQARGFPADGLHRRAQQATEQLLGHVDEQPPWQGDALPLYAIPAVQPLHTAPNLGPNNITGTYRGSWRQSANGPSWSQLPMLRSKEGNIVYQLRSIPGPEGMVHNVQGEIVLRDGHSITDRDVRMHLEGFYVAATGRLHGVVEPQVPIRVPLEDQLQQNGKGGPPDYREALRAVARQWAVLGNPNAPELLNAADGLLLLRECKFRVELNVRSKPPSKRTKPAAQKQQRHQHDPRASTAAASGGAWGGGGFDGFGDGGGFGVQGPLQTLNPEALTARSGVLLPQALWGQGEEGRAAAEAEDLLRADEPLRLRMRHVGRRGAWEVVREAGEQDESQLDVVMDGLILSDNCNASWGLNASTIHLERYYTKAVRYSLAITALTFGQILLLVLQMEASSTPAAAARVSLLSISQLSLMDAYLCLLHLTAALVLEPLFNAFALAAFFQFVVFAVFEMRLLLLVWRAQRPWLSDAWAARRELSLLYSRFYGVLLGGIFLAYQLQHHITLLLFAAFSFWLPQIVHSAVYDARAPLRPSFIIGMSATRLALPLYLFGCPHNVLRVAPQPGMCFALVLWVGLQAGLLLLQHFRGPRCFVPRRWLPLKYDYFRRAALKDASSSCGPACCCDVAVEYGGVVGGSSSDGGGSSSEGSRPASRSSCCGGMGGSRRASSSSCSNGSCSSLGSSSCSGGCCADAAECEDAECGRGSSKGSGGEGCSSGGEIDACYGGASCCIECVICMSSVDVANPHARMVTPCGHFFHEPCLLRWMDVKMECPTCRRTLPPL